MRQSPSKLGLIVSCAFAVLALAVFYTTWLPGHKYPLGITIEEARLRMIREYPLRGSKRDYPTGGPTAAEQLHDDFFSIRVDADLCVLLFNKERRLIRVMRWWEP